MTTDVAQTLDAVEPACLGAGPLAPEEIAITLPSTPAHPRSLRVVNDGQFKQWWHAALYDAYGHQLCYASTWTGPPHIDVAPDHAVLWVSHTQIPVSLDEVELLRPLTAHGLVIKAMETQAL